MPLKTGYSKKTISLNVGKMISEGYPLKQATAASYESERKATEKLPEKKRQSILSRLRKING